MNVECLPRGFFRVNGPAMGTRMFRFEKSETSNDLNLWHPFGLIPGEDSFRNYALAEDAVRRTSVYAELVNGR